MLGFTFAAPLALAALIGLPALWILLRVTPPRPRRIDFPPLALVADLLPQRQTPARTPPWLLLLRLLIAAALILAVAGPVWSPGGAGIGGGKTPLLVLLDNDLGAAHDWRDRLRVATDTVEGAARDGRSVAVVGLADPAAPIEAQTPAAALERLRAIAPRPFLAPRDVHLQTIGTFLDKSRGAGIAWISDGVAGETNGPPGRFVKGLGDLAGNVGAALTVLKADRPPALALTVSEAGGKLVAHVLRAAPNGRDAGVIRALDQKGLPLAERDFAFGPDATATEAAFDMPTELRNGISRIEIANERSAGAVNLMDERGKRRRVGLVFGGTLDQSQPLLAPLYYLSRALEPFADVQQPRGATGLADSINQLLDNQVSVLVLADVGALDDKTAARIGKFVDEGGLLLRFAGPRLAAGNDPLVPVRLRRGGRTLGGTLSWDAPKTLAPFPPESPFAGLTPPADIGVRRQILAEPDGDLPGKTWASLQDGTPIVTAEKRGQGRIVLFHVTADTTWSNLPLSACSSTCSAGSWPWPVPVRWRRRRTRTEAVPGSPCWPPGHPRWVRLPRCAACLRHRGSGGLCRQGELRASAGLLRTTRRGHQRQRAENRRSPRRPRFRPPRGGRHPQPRRGEDRGPATRPVHGRPPVPRPRYPGRALARRISRPPAGVQEPSRRPAPRRRPGERPADPSGAGGGAGREPAEWHRVGPHHPLGLHHHR